jgi:hypothetical protein
MPQRSAIRVPRLAIQEQAIANRTLKTSKPGAGLCINQEGPLGGGPSWFLVGGSANSAKKKSFQRPVFKGISALLLIILKG